MWLHVCACPDSARRRNMLGGAWKGWRVEAGVRPRRAPRARARRGAVDGGARRRLAARAFAAHGSTARASSSLSLSSYEGHYKKLLGTRSIRSVVKGSSVIGDLWRNGHEPSIQLFKTWFVTRVGDHAYTS